MVFRYLPALASGILRRMDDTTPEKRPRLRMPIEDRVPPEDWVTEQPSAASATAEAEAQRDEQERIKFLRWAGGGA